MLLCDTCRRRLQFQGQGLKGVRCGLSQPPAPTSGPRAAVPQEPHRRGPNHRGGRSARGSRSLSRGCVPLRDLRDPRSRDPLARPRPAPPVRGVGQKPGSSPAPPAGRAVSGSPQARPCRMGPRRPTWVRSPPPTRTGPAAGSPRAVLPGRRVIPARACAGGRGRPSHCGTRGGAHARREAGRGCARSGHLGGRWPGAAVPQRPERGGRAGRVRCGPARRRLRAGTGREDGSRGRVHQESSGGRPGREGARPGEGEEEAAQGPAGACGAQEEGRRRPPRAPAPRPRVCGTAAASPPPARRLSPAAPGAAGGGGGGEGEAPLGAPLRPGRPALSPPGPPLGNLPPAPHSAREGLC